MNSRVLGDSPRIGGQPSYQNREPGQDWMTMKLRGKYTLPEHIRSKAPELRQYLEVNGFGMRWHSPMNGGAPINKRSRQVKDIWKKEKGKKKKCLWDSSISEKCITAAQNQKKDSHQMCQPHFISNPLIVPLSRPLSNDRNSELSKGKHTWLIILHSRHSSLHRAPLIR